MRLRKAFDNDEHLRRMAEPETLRSLRRQLEQIEDEEPRAAERAAHDYDADHIRREIKRRGHRPVA